MIFLSDLDGVGSDWDGGFDLEATTNYAHVPGIPLRHERHHFGFAEDYQDETRAAIQEILDLPRFYDKLEPLEGWIDAMHEMEAEGHDVLIVTTPFDTNPTCADDKRAWVARHLGTKWRKRVILTDDKTAIMGDFLIDDKPKVITGLFEPVWERIVFDQHYNQNVPGRRLFNMRDWRSLLTPVP